MFFRKKKIEKYNEVIDEMENSIDTDIEEVETDFPNLVDEELGKELFKEFNNEFNNDSYIEPLETLETIYFIVHISSYKTISSIDFDKYRIEGKVHKYIFITHKSKTFDYKEVNSLLNYEGEVIIDDFKEDLTLGDRIGIYILNSNLGTSKFFVFTEYSPLVNSLSYIKANTSVNLEIVSNGTKKTKASKSSYVIKKNVEDKALDNILEDIFTGVDVDTDFTISNSSDDTALDEFTFEPHTTTLTPIIFDTIEEHVEVENVKEIKPKKKSKSKKKSKEETVYEKVLEIMYRKDVKTYLKFEGVLRSTFGVEEGRSLYWKYKSEFTAIKDRKDKDGNIIEGVDLFDLLDADDNDDI